MSVPKRMQFPLILELFDQMQDFRLLASWVIAMWIIEGGFQFAQDELPCVVTVVPVCQRNQNGIAYLWVGGVVSLLSKEIPCLCWQVSQCGLHHHRLQLSRSLLP